MTNRQQGDGNEGIEPEPTPKPSQAEGCRDDDEGVTGTSIANDGADQAVEPQPTSKPSQAEGDRDTIDADLSEKEASGEL